MTTKYPRPTTRTVNLYGEDGIVIWIDQYGDYDPDPGSLLDGPVVRVVGHALYTCTLDDAHRRIRDGYVAQLRG